LEQFRTLLDPIGVSFDEQGNASGGMEMDRSLKSLSGGERSFALVSLILSLWTVMTPPFRSA